MTAILLFGAFVVALCLLMALRIPVAVSLGLIGIAGTAIWVSPAAVVQLANLWFSQANSFILVVVPMFVLMGEVIARSGLGAALFDAAAHWLRRLPGGLAVATIVACTGFAAVCGSSPVTAATMGSIAVPEMVRNGYRTTLALGATAAGGTLGILIPPSVPLILYGVITNTSIGDLFLAGIIPGLMLSFLLALTVVILVKLDPGRAPQLGEPAPLPVRMRSLGRAAPVAVIAVGVIGSIYAGFATPTEAGAVGAFGAILVAAVMGKLRRNIMTSALGRTVRITAMFMLLLVGGLFSSFVLTRLGVPQELSRFLTSSELPPLVILLLINAFLLVLGMVLDPLSILVIVVPIFLSAVTALGYDPVWFGIIVTIEAEIAAITPPVGFNLFVLKSVVPEARQSEVVRGALVFVIPLLVGLGLIIAFPAIPLWLPGLF